jgi:hypothetical protein
MVSLNSANTSPPSALAFIHKRYCSGREQEQSDDLETEPVPQESEHFDLLVEHARRALIHEIGAKQVEVWLGKSGVTYQSCEDLAAIVVKSLWPLFETQQSRDLILSLHQNGTLAPPPSQTRPERLVTNPVNPYLSLATKRSSISEVVRTSPKVR